MRRPSWIRHRSAAAGIALLVVALLLLLWLERRDPTPVDTSSRPPATAEETAPAPPQPSPVTEDRREPEPLPPAPEPPVEEPPVVEPPEIVECTVRDVWNGAAVPGLSFALNAELDDATRSAAGIDTRTDTGEWVLPSVLGGLVRVPAEHVAAALRPLDSEWQVIGPVQSGGDETPTIWVHAWLSVTGTVRASTTTAALALEDVVISTQAHGADPLADPTERGGTAAVNESWLAKRGLRRPAEPVRADAHGRFSFRMPRLPTTTIRATASPPPGSRSSGWKEATYTIPDKVAASGSVHADLVLERGYEISGQLVDEDGKPVAGVSVRLHVVHYIDKADMVIEKMRRFGVGYTAQWDPTMPKAVVDYQIDGRTDEQGRFSIESKVDGELTLTFKPDTEHHIENVPVGRLSRFARDEPFALHSSRGPGVRLVNEIGLPFAGHPVSLLDISYGDIQPLFQYKLGDDSILPSRFLVEGHEYHIGVKAKKGGGALPIANEFFIWNGQTELVIRAFSMNRRSSKWPK